MYDWHPGRNGFFCMVDHRSLTVGGGGDGAGLWLDDELNHGLSHNSDTFDNAPLNGGDVEFTVRSLEVFSFSR
jgi:hypothetical protein